MKAYLGDSVYVEFDGYSFVLTTENGGAPSNRIFLEPDVVRHFEEFRKRHFRFSDEEVQP